MSLIIDLLPDERRGPGVVERAILIEELRPQLEEFVLNAAKADNVSPGELALIVVAQPDKYEAHAMTREEGKAFLNKHRPSPHAGGYRGFDAPKELVVVALIDWKGGVTVAAFNVPSMEQPSPG